MLACCEAVIFQYYYYYFDQEVCIAYIQKEKKKREQKKYFEAKKKQNFSFMLDFFLAKIFRTKTNLLFTSLFCSSNAFVPPLNFIKAFVALNIFILLRILFFSLHANLIILPRKKNKNKTKKKLIERKRNNLQFVKLIKQLTVKVAAAYYWLIK